jgi:hypothetical protein
MAPSTLTGGADPRMRLAIHLRHYRTSLRTALEDKFPATVWLFGATFFRAAADAYVRECPPRTPCIAEYGSNFPEFIAGYERAAGLGYVEAFAKLEWLLGRASIALDQAPLAWDQLVSRGPDLLPNATLALQSGLGYLRAEQAVDQLMTLYLRDQEPASFELTACDAPIQVSGSRGSFRLERLTPGDFEFRLALSRGHSVNDAASRALETDERFDPGQALRELATAGLVISCNL